MSIDEWLRDTLASLTELPRAEVVALPDDTALLGAGLALSSLTGVRLLALIHERYGVDIAGTDLALDSMESIGTLRDYIAAHEGRLI